MSTFSGIICEIPNISVDRFDGLNLLSSVYFLSHCHSDHMNGLCTKPFLDRLRNNENIYLYCSEISYHILMNTKVQEIKDYVKIVSHREEVIVEVPPSEKYTKSQILTLTVIPAGHCPGSVMFLFESDFKRILYTGDIRLMEGDIRKMKQFLNCDGLVKHISTLYLDTTFLEPEYNYFPPRKISAGIICQLISEWILESPENCVHIVTPAKHGSEYLFVEIFKSLKLKVHVCIDHFELYRNVPEVEAAITASPGITQIHACWRKCSFVGEYKQSFVRSIKPCALWYKKAERGGNIFKQNRNYFKVAYSSHSSSSELKDIINFLQPDKIVPCAIQPHCSREDVEKLLQLLQENNPSTSTIINNC